MSSSTKNPAFSFSGEIDLEDYNEGHMTDGHYLGAIAEALEKVGLKGRFTIDMTPYCGAGIYTFEVPYRPVSWPAAMDYLYKKFKC